MPESPKEVLRLLSEEKAAQSASDDPHDHMPESPKELLRILGQLDAAQSAVDDPQSPPRVPAQVGMFGLGRRCRDVAFVHAPTVATTVDGPAGLHRRYIMQPASLLGPPSPGSTRFQSCLRRQAARRCCGREQTIGSQLAMISPPRPSVRTAARKYLPSPRAVSGGGLSKT
jgi:hypothetical protein